MPLTPSIKTAVTAIALFLVVSADAQTDFRRRINGNSAVPAYPVPYVVPRPEEVKAVIDRIKGYTFEATKLQVFDSKTGQEITEPDLNNLNLNAVVDRRFGSLNGWDYTNGVVMSAFSMISDETGDTSYFDYNVRFYDFIFKWRPYFEALQKQTGRRNEFSSMNHMAALDHCGSITCALIRTQQKHPDERYKAWIEKVDEYISKGQFRFEDGTLARQRPQPRALWTDDFYMSIPFLAQRGKMTGDKRYWDDAVRQVIQLSERLFVPEKGLYAHGWSENVDGYGPRFYWGRANGWATMAMAELLSVLPADYPGRDKVLNYYRQHMRRLVELQDGSGLWHNLLDHSETYLESSASAMFVYGLAKGVNEGWLGASFAPAAITGWNGLTTRVLPDGRLEGVCEGTTYANDSTYYFYRGAGSNTTFFGSALYAGLEVMKLVKNPAVKITPANPGAVNSAIHCRRVEDLPRVRE